MTSERVRKKKVSEHNYLEGQRSSVRVYVLDWINRIYTQIIRFNSTVVVVSPIEYNSRGLTHAQINTNLFVSNGVTSDSEVSTVTGIAPFTELLNRTSNNQFKQDRVVDAEPIQVNQEAKVLTAETVPTSSTI